MQVFVTGATGFIGRALCLRLRGAGHAVRAWVRDRVRAADLLGAEVALYGGDDAALRAAMDGVDAVVHLAGEPVLPRRWSASRKKALVDSRVGFTTRLVAAIGALPADRRPQVLLSASAVGYYGDRGQTRLDEQSGPGQGFLAELSQQWEAAAAAVEAHGLRWIAPRIGLVMGEGGGALDSMLLPFSLGLGGPIGGGAQRWPWIHLDDLLDAMLWLLGRPTARGAYNLTAPDPVTAAAFAAALGAALGRPAVLPAPTALLRLALGEAADALLHSQRVEPARLLAEGFSFRFPTLGGALAACLPQSDALQLMPSGGPGSWPASPYVSARRPRWRASAVLEVPHPIDEVAAFFTDPRNLGALTPAAAGLRTLPGQPPPGPGATIAHALQLGPVPLTWRGRFEQWEPPAVFVDVQEAGPYRCWWHAHRLEAGVAGGTRITDEIWFAAPLGPLGVLAEHLFVNNQLRAIFHFRRQALNRRFGTAVNP
jgi:uncharacterized protein (TIGR01777 family)